MSLYGQGVLDTLRSYSRSLATDTCIIYPQGSTNSTPNMNNRGNPSQANAVTYPGVPCRMDVNSDSRVADNDKAQIIDELSLTHLYIALVDLQAINYVPETDDEIETTAGHPLSQVVRYRVAAPPFLETDDVDCDLLLERLP